MDLIDREVAITLLTFAEETGRMSCGELKGVIEVLNRLPSVQPNTSNTLESLDCIDRQAALDALKRAEALTRAFGYHIVIDTIQELPSAQPEIIYCSECKHAEVDPIFHAYWCNGNKVATDHYCGYAERREE